MLFALIEQVRQLTARVAELEARLSKDSHNSSKPPSRDGLTKKTRSLRVSSVAKPGGQFGRVGKTLKRSNAVDVVIEYLLPQHCTACGIPLMAADAVVDKRRQVFDIPVARYQVTEHRTPQVHCTCGQLHQSQFPENVTEVVQYGPNVRALAAHLTEGQLLPLGRTAQLITQLFALTVAPATVLAWIGEASARLRPNVERIAQALIDVPVAHADESGLRVAAKLHWLHTVASETHTWYGVHAKRGMLAMRRAWHPAQANWDAGARLLGTILATRLRARPVQCTPVARIDVFARNHRTELAQTHDGAAHPCPYTL